MTFSRASSPLSNTLTRAGCVPARGSDPETFSGHDLAFDEAYTRRAPNQATHHVDARLAESPPCDGCPLAARSEIERLRYMRYGRRRVDGAGL
jgi:hypothetical protein